MSLAISALCTACGACISTCPERALMPSAKKPFVDDSRCTLCLACVEICPRDAIGISVEQVALGAQVAR